MVPLAVFLQCVIKRTHNRTVLLIFTGNMREYPIPKVVGKIKTERYGHFVKPPQYLCNCLDKLLVPLLMSLIAGKSRCFHQFFFISKVSIRGIPSSSLLSHCTQGVFNSSVSFVSVIILFSSLYILDLGLSKNFSFWTVSLDLDAMFKIKSLLYKDLILNSRGCQKSNQLLRHPHVY